MRGTSEHKEPTSLPSREQRCQLEKVVSGTRTTIDQVPAIGAEADVPEWSVAHLLPGSVVTLMKAVLHD